VKDIHSDSWICGEEASKYSQGNYSLNQHEDGTIHLYQNEKDISREFKTYSKEYSSQELEFLAVCFTSVKILYLNGILSIIPHLMNLLEPTRNGKNLHQTSIRNEQAYYAEISQLMCITHKKLPLPKKDVLYVCGDSHSLSTTWNTIKFHEEEKMLKSVLVTGLKTWHLRKESEFYPKANFYNAISTSLSIIYSSSSSKEI
jgi:hypothetical protein